MNTNNNINHYEIVLNNKPRIPDTAQISAYLETGLSLNKSKATEWANAHNKYYRDALNELVNNITRVTHAEFTRALKACIDRLNADIGNQANYVTLVEPNKSNLWVAELAYEYLNSKPKQALSLGEKKATEFCAYLERLPKSQDVPQNIVLFDDASYSGTQLTEHIQAIFTKYIDLGHSRKIKFKLPKIYVVAPYSTDYAKSKINELIKKYKDNLKFFNNEKIKSIKDVFDEAQDQLAKLRELYNWNEDDKEIEGRGVVYFDHKIPNGMSFVEPLTDGSVYPGKDRDENGNLVNAEEKTQEKKRTANQANERKGGKQIKETTSRNTNGKKTAPAAPEKKKAHTPPASIEGILPPIKPPYKA